MRTLNYQLKVLCEHNRDGSFVNKAKRATTLQHIADQLHDLGYIHMNVHSLKRKHVVALIKLWQDQGMSPRTQANRIAFIRWWAQKVGRMHVLDPTNVTLGLVGTAAKNTRSKAWTITPDQLAKIKDPYSRLSIRMQQAFGLRCEESLKFQPSYADHIDYIDLKGSWTKGGRPRTIPVTTPDQRPLLDEVRAKVGGQSLIPEGKSYIEHLHKYRSQVVRSKLRNLHGLRHAYAQRRYLMLTGWPCPFQNGKSKKELTLEELERDQVARLQVSQELGHGRIEITSVYLG